MRRTILAVLSATILAMSLSTRPAAAFPNSDPRKDSCKDCNSLTREEAASVLREIADNVVAVAPGPFPGIWEVDVAADGKIFPVYLDYSKKYFFHGQILRVSDRENITRLRYEELNRVDVSSIPLKDAILLGNPSSKRRIIVLSDPTCPHCVRLHGEIKKAIEKDPEVAFYIMPFPRNPGDRANYANCLAAVCDKSGKVLDDLFSGKKIAPPTCKSDAVDETIRLAERIRIRGTPTLILPDGRVASGFRDADALLALTR